MLRMRFGKYEKQNIFLVFVRGAREHAGANPTVRLSGD